MDMTSTAELRAQNEQLMQEIDALLRANMTLDKEVKELTSECDELRLTGSNKVQTLEQELETVDKELTSLRSQCQSIIEVVKNADIENKVEVEEDPTPVSVRRKLSSVMSQTLQRAKGVSMPEHRRASTVEMVAHGLIAKAASYAALPTERPGPDVKMNKDSPAILSYAKSTSGATKSLLFKTHSHYDNFRRRSPCRKNRDSVMVL
ncbi:hypothetical protein KXD40_005772 [Peronospora effusa]|uniref:Uncharacterized protein n=1 Tax=Peronospora effusa TaxID=542832 RepID=A0A3M6VLK8_9STRA|nr:hypothetical protein DD238_000931 [Peronospora effusa]UIZ27707.1 hypothetical protein KXD40_005772 [Peronospora effusa]CAI5700854.1 unnamed protein product [Peronospora effusa]